MRKKTAFRKLKKLRENQETRVYNAIKRSGNASTYELYGWLRIGKSSITGRLSDLEQKGLIYQQIRKEGYKTVTEWRATPSQLVDLRRAENWNKRAQIWFTKGVKNGFITNEEVKQFKKQSKLF